MPSASRFRSCRSARASTATWSLTPSTRTTARGLELKRRQIQLARLFDCRERDREVLDCEAGRVERCDLLVALPAGRAAGQDVSELGHPVSRRASPLRLRGRAPRCGSPAPSRRRRSVCGGARRRRSRPCRGRRRPSGSRAGPAGASPRAAAPRARASSSRAGRRRAHRRAWRPALRARRLLPSRARGRGRRARRRGRGRGTSSPRRPRSRPRRRRPPSRRPSRRASRRPARPRPRCGAP